VSVGSNAASPLAYVMLVAAALIYGAIFTVNKFAAIGGVPPLAYSFWQSFGAAIVLWIALTLNGERLGVTGQHLTGYIVIGLLVIGIPITLLTYIAPKLPAGVMTLVLALSPPFTFLLSVLSRLERFRLAGLLGLACGFVGVALVVTPGAALGSPGAWKWFLLALLAPLFFAASNVAAAVLRPPAASSAAMGAGVLLGSSVALLPAMLIAGQAWFPSRIDSGTVATLVAVAINAAFLVLFFEIIRRAGPTFFAQFNYLAVLAGVAWGALVFGERLTLTFFAAMLLMLAGVFLAGYRGRLNSA
jgi:drug/metabolite transporter (DMT)-like permease